MKFIKEPNVCRQTRLVRFTRLSNSIAIGSSMIDSFATIRKRGFSRLLVIYLCVCVYLPIQKILPWKCERGELGEVDVGRKEKNRKEKEPEKRGRGRTRKKQKKSREAYQTGFQITEVIPFVIDSPIATYRISLGSSQPENYKGKQ